MLKIDQRPVEVSRGSARRRPRPVLVAVTDSEGPGSGPSELSTATLADAAT